MIYVLLNKVPLVEALGRWGRTTGFGWPSDLSSRITSCFPGWVELVLTEFQQTVGVVGVYRY